MMDQQLSQAKLILLYIIHEKENITEGDLFDFVLFRGFMDFFAMQSYLDELMETGLVVKVSSQEKQYYTLRPEGDQVVELFRSRIPHSIREEIRSYAGHSFISDSPLIHVSAEVERISDEQYEISFGVHDYARPILNGVITAASEEAAARIRGEWLKKGAKVYFNLLKELNAPHTEKGGSL